MTSNISFTGLYQTYKTPQTLKASSNVAFKNYIEDMWDESKDIKLEAEHQKREKFEAEYAEKVINCNTPKESLKLVKEIVSKTLSDFGGTFGK